MNVALFTILPENIHRRGAASFPYPQGAVRLFVKYLAER